MTDHIKILIRECEFLKTERKVETDWVKWYESRSDKQVIEMFRSVYKTSVKDDSEISAIVKTQYENTLKRLSEIEKEHNNLKKQLSKQTFIPD